MKQGFLIDPYIEPDLSVTKVTWSLNPYEYASGVTRAFQRFTAIALTTQGTDTLRPWFGTKLSSLPRMNVGGKQEAMLFARDQITDAITQFLTLQGQESANMSDDDYIDAIDIVSITIDTSNKVSIQLMFYARTKNAILVSLNF